MVSARAKVRLRSTERRGESSIDGTRDARVRGGESLAENVFVLVLSPGKPCPFSRATFAISSTGAPREVLPGHGCWFCGIRARDGGSRWLGAEPRDAGTERRAPPLVPSRRASRPAFARTGRARGPRRARRMPCHPRGALSRTNISGAGDGRGTHLHDGSDGDTLADEGGGGECGDHF